MSPHFRVDALKKMCLHRTSDGHDSPKPGTVIPFQEIFFHRQTQRQTEADEGSHRGQTRMQGKTVID